VRPSRPILIALAVLVLAGGALRCVEAANPATDYQSTDELSYQRLAIDLATASDYGEGLRAPLHWPPGAPVFFAVAHKLQPDPDIPLAYWFQALVGTLTIVVVFALGFLLAGGAAGLAAAAIVAFFEPYIALTGQLLSEGLGTFLLACAALATVAAWRPPHPRSGAPPLERPGSWRWFAVAGVFWALAILTRANYVFVPPMIGVFMAIALRHDWRAAARTAGVLVATTLVVLAPWVAWASNSAGRFVLVTEGDASALFVGTFLPGGGTTSGMKDVLGEATKRRAPQLRDIPDRELEAEVVLNTVAKRHPDLAREDAIRAEVRENLRRYALGRPLEFLEMMLEKVRRTWILSSRVGAEDVIRAVRIFHGAFVVIAFLLTCLALYFRRDLRLWILFSVPLYSALMHAVLVAKPRYNMPPFALLVVCGCVSAAWLVAEHRRRAAGGHLVRV
jgi:4-amino-4-deoxy-L-arabinose transferase-like glycosyltransferase